MSTKTAFVSYAHGNKDIESLALKIATRLQESGVNTLFDKWDLKLGDDKNYFMEQIKSKDFVFVVCDVNYRNKSNNRIGGVGTETQIIAESVYDNIKNSRIIPIVADSRTNIPIFLENRISIDFSDSTMFDEKLEELLRHIYEELKHKKPFLGSKPPFGATTKDEQKKVRSIMRIISTYLDINSNEKLVTDKPAIKNWQQKIIFEFYKLTNKLTDVTTNFLYFHESSTQSKVVEYIRDNNLHDWANEKLIVLTDKPRGVKDPKERLENLKQVFNATIFFIEDFCYEHLYKDFLQSKFEYSKFEISNFIASKYGNGENALSELDAWYKQDNEPIIIVKGFGGVGKQL